MAASRFERGIDESYNYPLWSESQLESPVFGPEYYTGQSARVRGFAVLKQVEALLAPACPIRVPRIMVVSPQILDEVEQNGTISEVTQRQIIHAARSLQENALEPQLSVRHAIVLPENNGRLECHNNLTTSTAVADALQQMAQEFIKRGYNQLANAQFGAFIQPFVDAPSFDPNHINSRTVLPAGGNSRVISMDSDGTVVLEIHHLFGDNSAVQHAPSDCYQVSVNLNNQIQIIRQQVGHKTQMLLERGRPGTFQGFALPVEWQDESSLTQQDLVRIALTTACSARIIGQPIKLEFSRGLYDRQGNYGPVFNELIPYTPENPAQMIKKKVQIDFVVRSLKDMQHLTRIQNQGDFPKTPAIYIDSEAAQGSTLTNIMNEAKSLHVPAYIFTPGLRETAHRARNATDSVNHRVFAAGTQAYKQGQIIDFAEYDGGGVVEQKRNHRRTPSLLSLDEAIEMRKAKPDIIGGKAVGLAFLRENGYNVPSTFILTDDFFHQVLKRNDISQLWSNLRQVKSIAALYKQFAAIKKKVQYVPRSWRHNLALLKLNLPASPTTHIVIRSNAAFEDAAAVSFAGLLESYISGVKPNDRHLYQHVLNCITAAFSQKVADALIAQVKQYQDRPEGLKWLRNFLKRYEIPVIIQEKINAKISGTVFYGEVIDAKRPHIIVIEAQRGVGGAVGGRDHRPTLTIKFNTQTQEFELITVTTAGDGKQKLIYTDPNVLDHPDAQLAAVLPPINLAQVRLLIRKAEEMKGQMKHHPDFEWAIGKKSSNPKGPNELWFLQSRPLD